MKWERDYYNSRTNCCHANCLLKNCQMGKSNFSLFIITGNILNFYYMIISNLKCYSIPELFRVIIVQDLYGNSLIGLRVPFRLKSNSSFSFRSFYRDFYW